MDKIALIFPGQGSQYPGLGKDSFELSSFAKDLYSAANDILGYNIKEISFNSNIDQISNTKYAQPLIFIYSILATYYLKEKGFKFDMVSGHSLGEISALVSAKSISIEDALKIIKVRASTMASSGYKNPGKMLALLNATKEQVDELCNIPTIVIANINSENQVVVSGSEKNIEKAIDVSKKIDIRKVIKVNVSGAFHSPLMKDVTDDLKKTLDNVNFNDAIMPVYQNMTSEPTINKVKLKRNLLNQIENQVNWVKIINNMDKDNVKLYIETGPGTVLQGLNRRITKNKTIGFNEI